MSGDPLRDLDCAARIHVFGDARRSEAVTTNSFQDPGGLRPFLNQLQDTSTIQASRFNRFTILGKGRKQGSTWICSQARAFKPKIDRFFSLRMHRNFVFFSSFFLEPQPARAATLVVIGNRQTDQGRHPTPGIEENTEDRLIPNVF